LPVAIVIHHKEIIVPSKKQTHTTEKAQPKQKTPKPATPLLETAASPQNHPATIIPKAARNPRSLTPRDVLQLQSAVGNQFVSQLLAPQRPRPQPIQREEVGNQFYAHGAFMGAARRMLNDPKWNRILQTLMPDVYADVHDESSEGDLIPMLENNPVMAAYGLFKTQQLDRNREGGRSDRLQTMQAIEWDVWLDPDVINGYNVAVLMGKSAIEQQDKLLVDTMIIAHGNTKQTIIENKIGYPQYDPVKETAKSELGGARSTAWMDLFGRTIRLATADDPDKLMEEMRGEARHADEDDQSLYQTFEKKTPFNEVVELYKKTFGKETFSVLLDIKSQSAPHVLRKLIRELNRRGVHVYGVGTFRFSELNELDQIEQTVDGQEMGAPRAIKFFHGIGNLQTACTDGEVFKGDSVMFNAGSILDSVDWDADKPNADDAEIESIIQKLGEFKNTYGFQLGLYIQEGATDQRAAQKVTTFSNKHADIFDLGFSWGGISNDMGPVTGGGTGMGAQEWVPWNEWDEDEEPGRPPSTGFESTFSIKRFLESRHFDVSRGYVAIETHAEWDTPQGPSNEFFVTLRQDEWGRDSRYTRYRCIVGMQGTARWSGLEDGTYYLEIDVADQDTATLSGEVKVTF
jgi:hypothetical protein